MKARFDSENSVHSSDAKMTHATSFAKRWASSRKVRRVGSLGIGLVAFACSRTEPDRGGLMIVVSQDGPVDVARLDVNVQARGKTLLDNNYRVPQEAELPTTIAVVSNQDETSQATVRISAWSLNDSDELQPLDRRDAIVTQIPSDRVALLRVVLSGKCVKTVEEEEGSVLSVCADGNTCNPERGDCSGAVKVSAATLEDYHPGDENLVVVFVGEARGGGRDSGLADGAVAELSTREESPNATSSDGKATMSSMGETSGSSTSGGTSTYGATHTASSSEDMSSSGATEDAGPVCGGEVCVVRDAGGGRCGDGVVDFAAREDCEPGAEGEDVDAFGDSEKCNGATAPQNVRCKANVCGDGYTNGAAGETCDRGEQDTAACNGPNAVDSACQVPSCGDGYVSAAAGECGDQATDTSQCNSNQAEVAGCMQSYCGDNHVNPAAGEECEPTASGETYCNGLDAPPDLRCKRPVCGDGYVADSEACDDGGETPSCTSACTLSTCGDSYINVTAGEECDVQPDRGWIWCNAPEDVPDHPEATCIFYGYCGDGICNLRLEVYEEYERVCEWQTLCPLDCSSGTVVARAELQISCDGS